MQLIVEQLSLCRGPTFSGFEDEVPQRPSPLLAIQLVHGFDHRCLAVNRQPQFVVESLVASQLLDGPGVPHCVTLLLGEVDINTPMVEEPEVLFG